MTQEEKAKAYDEAIERAKEQLNGAKVFDYDNEQIAHDIRTTVYNIFPNLKESEDERIRKWLINTIKQIPDGSIEWETISKSDVLAWLDRASEENPDDKVEPEFHEGDSIYQLASANDGSHYEWNDDKHVLKKIADKVEPKFKKD